MSQTDTSDVRYVLSLDCPQQRGIVHAVTGFLVEHDCDIVESLQFDDYDEGRFYLRIDLAAQSGAPGLEQLEELFGAVADRWQMRWRLRPQQDRTRVLIMASAVPEQKIRDRYDLLWDHVRQAI